MRAFNDIIKISISTSFLWCLLALSCSMVSLQFVLVEFSLVFLLHIPWLIISSLSSLFCPSFFSQRNENANTIVMVRLVVLMFWPLAVTFGFCEYGERLTEQFDDLGDQLCQCDWYKLPMKIQRIFSIVVVNAQQSTTIHSFENTPCSRDTFKQVWKTFPKKKAAFKILIWFSF